MPTPFTDSSIRQLEQRGIPPAEAARQLERLRRGKAFLRLERPCTVGDGILRLADTVPIALCRAFAGNRARFTRFVPASGAATRMFQGLFPAELDPDKAARFRQEITRFPFCPELAELAGHEDLDDRALFSLLLGENGLGLADRPKGLLPLHRGRDYNRTAFDEHLMESHRLGITRFHFTVSPDHLALFEQQLELARDALGGDAGIDVGFSLQSPRTDTLALDLASDSPFCDERGELLFRPAGHGALLPNLEQCGGDLVLIRNIDNVVPQRLQEPYQLWTEILGGLLLQTQQQVFAFLERLGENPDGEALPGARRFLRETFGRSVDDTLPPAEQAPEIVRLLDRPIRVCGMVPVSGAPGGGPFWAKDALGQVTPQIVEGVQIDPDDPAQQAILAAATHFNPVNIACSLRDRQGKPYRLDDFVDPDAALITAKSHAGRDLLALERPGLWNGGMSGWNSLFIELPPETFNPVKTVFDLLLPAHRPDAK